MDETNIVWRAVEAIGSLKLDRLRAGWVSAFKKWTNSLGVADSQGLGELWAEFRLRNIEPPLDQVRD
jgi:hypothetical protein